jgi:aromatic-L-amino-acid decarboxylase
VSTGDEKRQRPGDTPGRTPDRPAESHGDIPPEQFRDAAHRVADLMADYLEQVGDYPVLPRLQPGDIRRALPAEAPEAGEPLERILDDYKKIIEPGLTHWNHPGFFAYFSITGSGPGVLGEALAAAANVNAMLWRTGPAPTELEETVCDWLRRLVGLPDGFAGHINDTASIATLLGLAAAREDLAGLDIRQKGLAGREVPPLTVYASEQAHSSVDKAAVTLGFGLENLRRIATDGEFRLDPEALERAIDADRREGRRPVAVVATAGTTSTTSVDPLAEIAEICEKRGIWLHVDAAYAGPAAICPELRPLFRGWEKADSIVLNPHKWLFTPIDCSVMLVQRPEVLKKAFSIVPEYLRTLQTEATGVTNLMDYGVQLGRRFRALKLWMVMRAFGAAGLRERIRAHCELARRFVSHVKAEPAFEICAPVPFSTVCFRAAPDLPGEEQDRLNQRVLDEVNQAGPVFLSHTRLGERLVLRLAVGNLRTTAAHVDRAWELIHAAHGRLTGGSGT